MCEESYKKLKECLTSTSVLSLPSSIRRYVIYCESSYMGLGCVLIQRGRVITFALEVVGVVFALKIWHHYL